VAHSERWGWHSRSDGQVGAFRAESQLISDIRHLDGASLGTRVRIGALLHQNVVTAVGIGLEGSLLGERSSIPGQVTADQDNVPYYIDGAKFCWELEIAASHTVIQYLQQLE
jgi:hypothetical protein